MTSGEVMQRRTPQARTLWIALLLGAGCGNGNGAPDGAVGDGPARERTPSVDARPGSDTPVAPITPAAGEYTYKLSESPGDLPLWTAPVAHKVQASERAPATTKSGLRLSAARHEHEPVQLVLGPAGGSVTVKVAPFPKLGSGQRLSLAVASYEAGWEEHLTPLADGGSVTLSAGQGTPLWLTVYVPEAAPAGEHTTTLTLTRAAGAVTIPVTLYVFDFALPKEIHFDSQLNLSIATLKGQGSVLAAKTLLHERRLTPTSVPWPSGFGYAITWENSASPSKCSAFFDEPNEGPDYSIKHLARKYILGEGWNGVGFPSAQLFQFVDNATPRPASFCGASRGDHFGTADYNAKWSLFLAALQGYLEQNQYLAKTYYYVQNEPQGDADYKLAAHLCRLTRKAAPKLRIAISEEPKKEIAEEAGGACGYDLWFAHIRAYQEAYAQTRQAQHGETVWFYSLDHDPDPYFNPTLVDRPGLHQRIIPWVSWHYRVTGWAYYDGGRFFDGALPRYRAELLREGFEDYEYLWLANGKRHGGIKVKEAVDATVDSVASSLTSWTKDADALAALRHELGRFIEGKRTSLPVLQSQTPGARPRGEYHLNFQDPKGKPTASPLVEGGKTYQKVGWEKYDPATQIGWSGENIGKPAITLYGYDDVAGKSEIQKSYLYDDYGRPNLFELGLENGKYSVTVGVGRPAKGYPNDPHNVTIEGVKVVDDEVTTSAAPLIERTTVIDLKDGSLSLEVGGKSQKTGDFAYTFLGYLKIVPAN